MKLEFSPLYYLRPFGSLIADTRLQCAQQELRGEVVGDDCRARTLEMSTAFADGARVVALRSGAHELHVAFDASAPRAVVAGLCAAVLETALRQVQNTFFAIEKK